MTQNGVYIFSYWTGTPYLSAIHTIAISYDANMDNNLYGYNYCGGKNKITPSDYSNNFICCYYLG